MDALSSPPQGPWYPVENVPSLHLLRFAGVRALLSDTEPDSAESLESIPLGSAPVQAWRVPGEIPRAWLAPRAQPVGDPGVALAAISESDLRSDPPVEGLAQPLQGEGTMVPVSVEELGASRRRMMLKTDHASLLVLSESWAPGWMATLNGKEVPVLRVGGAFMGVEVQAGESELRLEYRPRGWSLGCGASGLGLLLWAGLAGLRMRRRPRRVKRNQP